MWVGREGKGVLDLLPSSKSCYLNTTPLTQDQTRALKPGALLTVKQKEIYLKSIKK